jgi:hypothetical protein
MNRLGNSLSAQHFHGIKAEWINILSVLSPDSFFSLVLPMVVTIQNDLIQIKFELFTASFFGLELIKLFQFLDFFVSKSFLLFFGSNEANLAFGGGTNFIENFFEFEKGEFDWFRAELFLFEEIDWFWEFVWVSEVWGVRRFGELGHKHVGSMGLEFGVFFERGFRIGKEVATHVSQLE